MKLVKWMHQTGKGHAPNSSFVYSCTKLVHVIVNNYHAALHDMATTLRWKCTLRYWMKTLIRTQSNNDVEIFYDLVVLPGEKLAIY